MADIVEGSEAATPTIINQVPGMFTGVAGAAPNWDMGATSIVNGLGYKHADRH